MNVRWTRPALRDLEGIGDYVARDNPAAAARLIDRIFEQTAALAANAYRGRVGRAPDTRELVVASTPFIVPYRIRGDDIEILAVFHGARRWPDTFD